MIKIDYTTQPGMPPGCRSDVFDLFFQHSIATLGKDTVKSDIATLQKTTNVVLSLLKLHGTTDITLCISHTMFICALQPSHHIILQQLRRTVSEAIDIQQSKLILNDPSLSIDPLAHANHEQYAMDELTRIFGFVTPELMLSALPSMQDLDWATRQWDESASYTIMNATRRMSLLGKIQRELKTGQVSNVMLLEEMRDESLRFTVEEFVEVAVPFIEQVFGVLGEDPS